WGETRQPTRILIVVVLLVALFAFKDALWPTTDGGWDFIMALAFAICAFAWVKADAAARQIEPPAGSALLAALIIPIGIPVYLLRALGFRRGSWATLKAFGFIVV